MKKSILLLIVIASFFNINAQYNLENLQAEFTMQKSSEDNILKIYPIKANDIFRNAHKDISKFSDLEKAIKENKIIISEINASGNVNSLFVENRSSDSIILLAGEIVKGGKQDRIIGSDVIILPGERKNISAFCVERGRWSAGESGTSFKSYSHSVSQNVRKAAVVNKNQSEVWSIVSQVNSRNNVRSNTNAYTALEDSKEYKYKMQKYLNTFESAWDNDHRVVGIIAVSGDRVLGCDIFATHDIFVNAYNNLLHAYITDAISNGSQVTITLDKVNDYLHKLLSNESMQEEYLEDKGDIFKYNNKKLHISAF